jgi:diaminopimelate epimerase
VQPGEIAMDSPGGIVRARVLAPGLVSVDMGVPSFDPRSLPFEASSEAHVYPLEVAGTEIEIGAVSMGNPHAVLTVASVEAAPVDRLGPAIERHPRFPKRVNAGFMEIVDRSHIRLRVYERGTGETLACGTGACAAVAIGRRHGRLDERVGVELPGGRLEVQWTGPGEHIWLTGPAEVSFEGHVDLQELSR